MAFELIEQIEVGAGGTSAVEFASIPQDGTDLLLVGSVRTDGASISSSLQFRFNGSTSYSTGKTLRADGSTANTTDIYYPQATYGANGSSAGTSVFGSAQLYITNYASTTSNKVMLAEGNGENPTGTIGFSMDAIRWPSTTPITSLIAYASPTYQQYSTFYLYKIY